MPEPDLALLVKAARLAGDIALGHWRRNPRAWEKPDGTGPVTEADLAVNAMLADILRAARPDYGWLSEETPDTADRLSQPHTFILDPIDGTRAFMAGEEHFAHSFAIADQGRITHAVVFLPAINRLYSASITQPALCNGIPIHAAPPTASATILCARPVLAPEHWRTPPPVTRHFRASLAYRMCLVAEGSFDAMLTLRPTWEWDIAAGTLIASRAGAVVTDRSGTAPVFNQPTPQTNGLLTASPALHQTLHAALA